MMVSNVLTIYGVSINGKSLASGTKHDEMVAEFGATWLLASASLVRARRLPGIFVLSVARLLSYARDLSP